MWVYKLADARGTTPERREGDILWVRLQHVISAPSQPRVSHRVAEAMAVARDKAAARVHPGRKVPHGDCRALRAPLAAEQHDTAATFPTSSLQPPLPVAHVGSEQREQRQGVGVASFEP